MGKIKQSIDVFKLTKVSAKEPKNNSNDMNDHKHLEGDQT